MLRPPISRSLAVSESVSLASSVLALPRQISCVVIPVIAVTRSLLRTRPLLTIFLSSLSVCGTAICVSTETIPRPAPEPQKTQATAQVDEFIWSADLHDHGLATGKDALQRLPEFSKFSAVFFLDEKTVVTSFLTRQELPGLQRRNDPNLVTPYKLHAVLFDAATGHILSKLEWNATGVNVGVFARSDGNLLVGSLDRITVFTRDNKVVTSISLPASSLDDAYLARYRVSPTGNTVLIQYRNQTETECITARTDMGNAKLEKCGLTMDSAISDKGFVETRFPKSGGTPEVWIQDFGEPWRMLCRSSAGCGFATFVNDEKLLMYDRGVVRLIKTTGETLFHQEIGSVSFFGFFVPRPIRSSSNGERFGVLAANGSNDGPFIIGGNLVVNMDINPDHLQVYDVTTHKWVFALKNKKNFMKPDVNFALSSAGNFLAIEMEGLIRVYSLPPAAAADTGH